MTTEQALQALMSEHARTSGSDEGLAPEDQAALEFFLQQKRASVRRLQDEPSSSSEEEALPGGRKVRFFNHL